MIRNCTYHLRFSEEEMKHPKNSIIIYSGRFSDYSYGTMHPFNPGRAQTAMKLIQEQGYFDEPWMRREEPEMITKKNLLPYNDHAYIDILEKANSGKWLDEFVHII